MRVYCRNSKWYYEFMIAGKRKHGACKYCANETEALAYMTKIHQEEVEKLKSGKPEDTITIQEMFDAFLVYSKANKKDYPKDKSKVEVLKQYFDFTQPITSITSLALEEFKIQLIKDRELSNATFNRYYALISKAFNFIIVSNQLNMQNPCLFVKKLKEDKHQMRTIKDNEIKLLLESLPTHLKPIVICALTTGLRRSNILNLKWENVDFENNKIEIMNQDNKGFKHIVLPLSNVLKNALKSIKNDSEYVFINPETNKPYTAIYKGYKNAFDKAKIPYVRFHDLRHKVGTYLIEQGVDINTVKNILSHSNIRTTQIYLNYNEDKMKKAIDILDGLW